MAALPAPAELESVRGCFLDAYAGLEDVTWKVGTAEGASDDDLGRAGRFRLDVRQTHEDLGTLLEELDRHFNWLQLRATEARDNNAC